MAPFHIAVPKGGCIVMQEFAFEIFSFHLLKNLSRYICGTEFDKFLLL